VSPEPSDQPGTEPSNPGIAPSPAPTTTEGAPAVAPGTPLSGETGTVVIPPENADTGG